MILGIGNDIIEVSRIRGVIQRHQKRFLDRVFTLNEQAYCLSHREPAIHFAGRFAAKEAVVKALGTGFNESISWNDIEISNTSSGKPCVVLSARLKELLSGGMIDISISHCHEYATAFAIWHRRI